MIENGWKRLLPAVSKSLLFMSVIVIRNICGREKTETLNFTDWVKFLVCPVVTIFAMCAVCYEFGGIRNLQSDISNLIIVIGLVVINVATAKKYKEGLNNRHININLFSMNVYVPNAMYQGWRDSLRCVSTPIFIADI